MTNSYPTDVGIRASVAKRWLSAALFGLCALGSNLARADAPASAALPAQQASAPAPIQSLPEVPRTTPSLWLPDAIARSMGAKCQGPSGKGENWVSRCTGPMPAHLARFIEALPDDLFNKDMASAALRRQALHTELWDYWVAPGRGQHPDFLIDFGNVLIKTLKGPDPNVTVVAVWRQCKPRSACVLLPDPRIFRFVGEALIQDVTAALWPGQPVITTRQKVYLDRARVDPYIFVDTSKLAYAPTIRWGIELGVDIDWPHGPSPLPRSWNIEHMGFVTWTGTRFERRLTVPRRLWPCLPALKDENEAPCSRDDDIPKFTPFLKYVTP